MYWNLPSHLLYISDSTSLTRILIYIPITSDCFKGYEPKGDLYTAHMRIITVLCYQHNLQVFLHCNDIMLGEYKHSPSAAIIAQYRLVSAHTTTELNGALLLLYRSDNINQII